MLFWFFQKDNETVTVKWSLWDKHHSDIESRDITTYQIPDEYVCKDHNQNISKSIRQHISNIIHYDQVILSQECKNDSMQFNEYLIIYQYKEK